MKNESNIISLWLLLILKFFNSWYKYYWLKLSFSFTGAKKSREVVFSVLRDACIDGDLSVPEAVEAAKDIFARNAIHFYKISPANSVINSHSNLSQNLSGDLDIDVSLVRVMWVDGAGQHRCRVSHPHGLFSFYFIVLC